MRIIINYTEKKTFIGEFFRPLSVRKTSFYEAPGLDWSSIYKNTEKHDVFKQLDSLVSQHVKDFWAPYGLATKISLEQKLENTGLRGGYFSKAHYLLLSFDPRTCKWDEKPFVIRGSRLEKGLKPHLIYGVLEACVGHAVVRGVDLEYKTYRLLRLNE